jgi:hypothetical protein
LGRRCEASLGRADSHDEAVMILPNLPKPSHRKPLQMKRCGEVGKVGIVFSNLWGVIP